MMKRMSLIVAWLMVFWMVLGMSLSASAQYTFSLEATSDSAGNIPKEGFAPGEIFYLHIVLSDAGGVAGCAFTLQYPSDALIPPVSDGEGISPGVTSHFPFTYNSDQIHRGNSSEPGRIFLAGAAIDTSDGGYLYSSGDVILFSIRFTVSYDAVPGSFDISLKQTELWNLAAGYGVDNNGNGAYDEGIDEKGKVAVLIGAVDNTDPDWNNPAGAFPILLPNPPPLLAQTQLHVSDGAYYDELIVNFTDFGLYHYVNEVWKLINRNAPEMMLAVGTDLYVDFGSGIGLYKYDGMVWQKMNPNTTTDMVAIGNTLYAHFAGVGLYRYDGTWKLINRNAPEMMLAVGTDLYVDFGSGVGLYKYDGTGWQKMNPNTTTDMCAVNLQ